MSDQEIFPIGDIEDVRILLKVKGKHYSLVTQKGLDKDNTRLFRIQLGVLALSFHEVILPSLEEIKEKNIKIPKDN